MENQVQTFANSEFGQLRVKIFNGEPWFATVDSCNALGIKNSREALARLDSDEKMTVTLTDSHSGQRGGAQMMSFVSEPGLYRLIMTSRKPAARRFQRWVSHDVIPAIRKHGLYATPEIAASILNNPTIFINILQALVAERNKTTSLEEQNAVLEQQNAELQPKASYFDLILNCTDLVSTSTISKDYGMSAKEFNLLLHKHGIQFKQGKIWLLYQNYAQKGWTQTKTHSYCGTDGEVHSRVWMHWTPKGRWGIYEILKKHGILPLIERGTGKVA